MEEAVWSSYCWGGISRGLFGAFILAEGYGGSCSELLYLRRDLERPVPSNYISGGI